MTVGPNQSFWVIKNGKPEFVTGEIREEEEGEWCAGEERLHTPDGHYYPFYFNSPLEALKHEVEMATSRVEFERELMESEIESLEEEKQHWVNMLKEYENKEKK